MATWTNDDERLKAISSDLHSQWQDHWHMRDQTWKVVQYSILFFLGVVGLEIQGIDSIFLILAYTGVILTSAFGVVIAFHHRRRQKEKFKIIEIYEKELDLSELIAPVLKEAHKSWTGKINTSSYIVVIQLLLFIVSSGLLIRLLM